MAINKNGVTGQASPQLAPSTAPPLVSSDQAAKAATIVVGYAVAYGVGRGWLTTADAPMMISSLEQLVVPLLAIAHVLWVFYQNRKIAKVAAVQAMPDMQVVTTSETVKKAIPDVVQVPPTKPTP